MSIRAHLLDRLGEMIASWDKGLATIPEAELRSDREALRQECGVGASPQALLLAAYDREIGQRRNPGELPL